MQAVIDGVDSITGQQAGLAIGAAQPHLLVEAAAGGQRSQPIGSLDTRTIAWYNPSIKSLYSMVPGLIAVVLIMPALALALAFAREKELGSFEGLAATPIRGVRIHLRQDADLSGLRHVEHGPDPDRGTGLVPRAAARSR